MSLLATTGPAKCRLEKIRREMPRECRLRPGERAIGVGIGAKAFESSDHSPAPRESAPELQTVWRWTQSRANPSLKRKSLLTGKFNGDFLAFGLTPCAV